MILWVAPSEPKAFKDALKAEGRIVKVSSLSENYGGDVLWTRRGEWWTVQRKTVSDFVASVIDGRLAKELAQMRTVHGGGAGGLVVIEGEVAFQGGMLAGAVGRFGPEVTEQQWQGMVWAVGYQGIAVAYSRGVRGTAAMVERRIAWSEKAREGSLRNRPTATGKWGKATNREYGEHLLQGLPGVGVELAGRLMDKFGKVPWKWEVTEEELMQVDGIGKVKARGLMEALG